MKVFTCRTIAAGVLFAALLPLTGANAQLGDILKQGENKSGSSSGRNSGGGLGNLGSAGGMLSGHSLTSGSLGNVTGLLEFCLQNNYLKGNGASSIKDKLMGKIPGGSPSSDEGYNDGVKGLLKSNDGKQLDLSGGGMKAEIAKQACDKILAQGKSLL